jgi:outer membrane biosynthesis protein TonB
MRLISAVSGVQVPAPPPPTNLSPFLRRWGNMNKIVTLASVGVFLLSLQGASLAQDKTPASPASPAVPPVAAPSVTGPVETPATPEATSVKKTKKSKKSKSTKKAKKPKKAKKAPTPKPVEE